MTGLVIEGKINGVPFECSGIVAQLIDMLLQEKHLIESCGNKMEIRVAITDGKPSADITKKSITPHSRTRTSGKPRT